MAFEARQLAEEVFRWTGRVLGTLLVLLFVVFFIGEGPPRPSLLTGTEKMLFAATIMMLVGLLAAWRWEGIGGALAVLGYILFAFVAEQRTILSPFLAGAISGCCFLLAWWISNQSKWREGGGPRRLEISLVTFGAAFVLTWIWLGAGARSMPSQSPNLPNLSGEWVGTGFVSDTLVHKQKVDVDVTVLPDGAVQGRLGDATIVSGFIAPRLLRTRRDYLLSRIGEPGYKISLQLTGPALATPRRSLPHADLLFNLQSGQMIGELHLTDIPEELRDLHLVLRRKTTERSAGSALHPLQRSDPSALLLGRT